MNNNISEKIKFGTDGWRAVIAEDFTFANVSLITLAICKFLKNNNLTKRGVFIGYDNRFLSENFAEYAAKILAKNNIKVFLAGTSVPTPLTAFMTVDLKLDGSIMITASHNPYIYNGIKFIPYYGGPAEDKITREIEENLSDISTFPNQTFITSINKSKNNNLVSNLSNKGIKDKDKIFHSNFESIEIISDFKNYKDKLLSLINTDLIKKIKPKVAVDLMFGAASNIFPEIINKNLDLQAQIFNDKRDPLFNFRLPDPSESNLSFFREYILKNKFDLGVALDGDADRFGVIDGNGIFISPNNVIAMILYYFIELKKYCTDDLAVRTVATTHLIDEICTDHNLGFVETPVGFKHIAKEMLNKSVIIGGEESGGLSIKGHIPEKDGLLACLLLIEIQSYIKEKYGNIQLSDYLSKIYKKYGEYYNIRIDLDVPLDKKKNIISYFLNLQNSREYKEILDIEIKNILVKDGAKVIFDDNSWILVRASGTEPLIRCYIESKNKVFFENLVEFAKFTIKKLSD